VRKSSDRISNSNSVQSRGPSNSSIALIFRKMDHSDFSKGLHGWKNTLAGTMFFFFFFFESRICLSHIKLLRASQQVLTQN